MIQDWWGGASPDGAPGKPSKQSGGQAATLQICVHPSTGSGLRLRNLCHRYRGGKRDNMILTFEDLMILSLSILAFEKLYS